MFYYPHVAELNTRMMALDDRINTLSQRMDHDFDAALYYMRIGMETQQANRATVYANNQAIAQCCCNTQRMADLQNRMNAQMVNTYTATSLADVGVSWLAAPDMEGWVLGFASKPKKKLTLEELNRILFPDDPIRDWSERTLAAIEAKYAWLNDYE